MNGRASCRAIARSPAAQRSAGEVSCASAIGAGAMARSSNPFPHHRLLRNSLELAEHILRGADLELARRRMFSDFTTPSSTIIE
jgi:hypothetical protein